jgi:hypothetical protein
VLDTQPRPTIRTIVASFLFTDLVGFSKGTAADQFAAKANLSAALRRHLAPLRESDYWIKDTGDGALIAFISNPEHALYMALALGHDYGAPAEGADERSPRLRTGLHLGTVKESVDVEARRNFIGDGINAAKRVMDFAVPGQIAASRSFYEAIANLDAAYSALFQHVGESDDKHGRAHDLYSLAPSDAVLERLRTDLETDASEAAGAQSSGTATAVNPTASASHAPAARISRPVLLLAIAVLLGATAFFWATRMREPQAPSNPVADAPRPAATAPSTTAGKDDRPLSAPTVARPSTPAPERTSSSNSVSAPPAPAPVPPRASERTERPAETTRTAPSPPAKTSVDARPKISTPPPFSAATSSGPSSLRCSRILQKAAVGEPLTTDEKKELADTCR